MGNWLYLAGTALQVYAYMCKKVSLDVCCWAGVAYWLALWIGFKWGNIR